MPGLLVMMNVPKIASKAFGLLLRPWENTFSEPTERTHFLHFNALVGGSFFHKHDAPHLWWPGLPPLRRCCAGARVVAGGAAGTIAAWSGSGQPASWGSEGSQEWNGRVDVFFLWKLGLILRNAAADWGFGGWAWEQDSMIGMLMPKKKHPTGTTVVHHFSSTRSSLLGNLFVSQSQLSVSRSLHVLSSRCHPCPWSRLCCATSREISWSFPMAGRDSGWCSHRWLAWLGAWLG